jgi:hypothetical protein
MFGPLNGVRTTLVAGAVICAIVGLILGYPVVAVVLAVGIAAHGGLWWWMYQHRQDGNKGTGPPTQPI